MLSADCGVREGLLRAALPLALPPRGFREASGVVSARETSRNPHQHASGSLPPSGAQLAGLRYERKVKDFLLAEFGHSCIPGPWWEFFDGHGRRYCQPDCVVRRGDHIAIFEIKIRWCADAWWQLARLYLPVARQLFPHVASFHLCAVVRSFDPLVAVPAPVRLIDKAAEALSSDDFVVLPWRGK